jgi:hypothetical protein
MLLYSFSIMLFISFVMFSVVMFHEYSVVSIKFHLIVVFSCIGFYLVFELVLLCVLLLWRI